MNRTPIHVKHDIVPYCATCKKAWPPDEQRRLRLRFICPEDKGEDEPHIASLVKGEVGKKWLHIEKFIIDYEFATIKIFKRFFRTSAPLQIIFFYFVLILSFSAVHLKWINGFVAGIISGLIVFHLLILTTSITFFSRFPAHPLRSVVTTLQNFIFVVASFGLFYFSVNHNDNFLRILEGPIDAIYFSIVTITTLGYGEIVPNSSICKIVTMIELIIGIYFLAIILTVFTSWINEPPEVTHLKTYDELFPDRTKNSTT